MSVDSVWVSAFSYVVFRQPVRSENTCHVVPKHVPLDRRGVLPNWQMFRTRASGASSLPGDMGTWGRNGPADRWESMPRFIRLA